MSEFRAIETQCLTAGYVRRICRYGRRFGCDTLIAMSGEWDQYTLFDYREFGFPRESWEYEFAARKRQALAAALRIAHEEGMRFYAWRHELSMHPEHIRQLNPALLDYCYGGGARLGPWGEGTVDIELGFFEPTGHALWRYLDWRFDHLFELFPDLDGVVLTCLTETKLPLWNFSRTMSRASILARLLRRAINGCHRRGKQLIVRNWGAYRDPQNPQGHLLYEALAQARAPKSVLVMDKAYEPDFALGYPFNAGLRQLASRHPTVVELELAGEQEGMETVPVASPQESQVAVEQALACGCRGFVVRVDSSPDTTQWWHTHRTLDTVNEINLYACLRLIQEPTVTLQAVWSEWAQRFGAAADAVIALLQPTFALGQRLYLCQGNLFSNSPYSVAHATRNLRHYSRYRYTRTPADRYWQTVLPAADAGALGELLAEKRAACRGYEAGYQLACRLSGLPRKWQRLFEDGFRHGADVARVYLYFAEMVVRYARWQQDGSAAERRRLLRLVAVAEAHLAAGAFPNRRLGRVVAGQMDMVVMARRQLQRFSARLAESD